MARQSAPAASAPAPASPAAAVYLPVGELRPNPRNPRVHGEDVARLARVILRTAWGAPIVAQARSKRVIGGHGRLEAAKAILAGLEIDGEIRGGPEHLFDRDAPGPGMVPVRLVDVSDAEADAMTAADNARALQGVDDGTRVLELLSGFGRGTALLADIGYTDDVLDGIVAGAGDSILAAAASGTGADSHDGAPEPDDARKRTAAAKEFVGGYAVAVLCDGEQHQQEVFEALKASGYQNLKVLTL